MSRVIGTDNLRKIFSRVDKDISMPVRAAVKASAKRVEVNAIANALKQDIRDEGDMIRSITSKITRKGLVAIVGPGADSAYVRKSAFANLGERRSAIKTDVKWLQAADDQMNFMKGYWAEITVPKHVSKPRRPFMNPAYEDSRLDIQKWFDKAVFKSIDKLVNRYYGTLGKKYK